MKNLFKNLVSGASDIRLDFIFYKPYNFQDRIEKSKNDIKYLAQLRKISEQEAMKAYFKERLWGQVICFLIALVLMMTIMGLAIFTKIPEYCYIPLIIALYIDLFGPHVLVYHWNKSQKI